MSYAQSQGSKEVDEDVSSDAALIPPVDESALTRRPRLSPQGVTECTLSIKAVRPAGTCLSGTSSFVMLSERTLLRGKINNNASLYIILL
jgi:hypothetical protein